MVRLNVWTCHYDTERIVVIVRSVQRRSCSALDCIIMLIPECDIILQRVTSRRRRQDIGLIRTPGVRKIMWIPSYQLEEKKLSGKVPNPVNPATS